MKVYPLLASSLSCSRPITDEYARRHEAELLRKLKAEVCTAIIIIDHFPNSIALDRSEEGGACKSLLSPSLDGHSDTEHQAKLQEKHDEVNSKH